MSDHRLPGQVQQALMIMVGVLGTLHLWCPACHAWHAIKEAPFMWQQSKHGTTFPPTTETDLFATESPNNNTPPG